MTPRLRLAFPTRLFEEPLRDTIRRAAATGVRGVQFDLRYELRPDDLTATGRRQLLHLLKEQELKVAPALFPLRRSLHEADGLEERVAALTAAIRFAALLRAKVVVVRPGAVPEADSDARRLMVEVLSDLARVGNHVGVTLAVTTGREEPAELKTLLESVTTGPVGVNLDAGGLAMAGRDPAEAVRTLAGLVSHVRARDGLRDADGAGVEVPVGRGEVAWEPLLATLIESNYAGFLTADRTGGENPAADATRAVQYLTNVMPF